MSKFTNPLEQVRVAAPCTADWEKMVGDERMRYCDRCSLHVYNLSGMTRREAEALVAGTEGRLCVRFYRRADGTILTRNCPVGLRALKRRVARVAGATLSAVLGFFAGLGLNFGLGSAPDESRHTMGTIAAPASLNHAPEPRTMMGQAVLVEEKGEAVNEVRGRLLPLAGAARHDRIVARGPAFAPPRR